MRPYYGITCGAVQRNRMMLVVYHGGLLNRFVRLIGTYSFFSLRCHFFDETERTCLSRCTTAADLIGCMGVSLRRFLFLRGCMDVCQLAQQANLNVTIENVSKKGIMAG
jgi:hypothetical protein